MNRIKFFAANLILVIPLLLVSFAAVNAQTDTTDKIFGACAQAPDSPACKGKTATENPVVRIINVAASIIAVLAGIAAVIMLILGGLSYVTAGGNAEKATNARRRIIYSIAGIVVVALAWAATRFITDRVIQ